MAEQILDSTTQSHLDLLLFGKDPVATDVERWHSQGFTFCEAQEHSFGLRQLHGGPCGILAPVQAWVLEDLIFTQKIGDASDHSVPLKPNAKNTTLALIRALSTVVHRAACGGPSNAANQQYCWVELASSDSDSDKHAEAAGAPEQQSGGESPAGSASTYIYKKVTGQAQLQRCVASSYKQMRSDKGCLLLVYSVLLSRGLHNIKSDMDDSSIPLVARFGHCSQELVNLMLCGRAVTNVFDGDKVLGDASDPTSFALHGIPQQNSIGFLTVLEALRYSKVGDNYKTPLRPIWVVGSSSHYTVLFSLDPLVGQVSKEDKKLHELKAAFSTLDAEENGFIPTSEVGGLLLSLELPSVPAADLNKLADPDSMGIVTWQNFLSTVKSLENRPSVWSCSACTFNNEGDKSVCDMCGGAKPPSAPAVAAAPAAAAEEAKESKAPTQFTLYHFNGIDRGKDRARCTPLRIQLLGAGAGDQGSTSKQGIREVILTRWPDAMVEYDAEPKII